MIDYGQYETHLFDSGTYKQVSEKENLVLTFLPDIRIRKAGCGLLLLVLPELDGQCISMGGISVNIVEPIDIGQTRCVFDLCGQTRNAGSGCRFRFTCR